MITLHFTQSGETTLDLMRWCEENKDSELWDELDESLNERQVFDRLLDWILEPGDSLWDYLCDDAFSSGWGPELYRVESSAAFEVLKNAGWLIPGEAEENPDLALLEAAYGLGVNLDAQPSQGTQLSMLQGGQSNE